MGGASRRDLFKLTLGVSLAGAMSGGAAASATSHEHVSFPDRWSEMLAYLKLRARTDDGDAWFWFSGSIDMMLPGARPVRIVDVDGLNIRRVRRGTDLAGRPRFRKTLWEAVVFSEPGTCHIADALLNPLNGRTIYPLHYREGATHYVIDSVGRHIVPTPNAEPVPRAPAEMQNSFPIEWMRVGNDIWIEKVDRIDAAHPLNPSDWPLESSGERRQDIVSITLNGRWSDAIDPTPGMAPASYSFTAATRWLPWMLMGQQPGQILYRAKGRKLADVREIPATVRAKFDARFPELFSEIPWTEKHGVFLDYMKQRQPLAR